MSDVDPKGMITAVALLGGAGDLGGDGAEQPQLFADADDAPASLTPAKLPPNGGIGRPKGARNRSTEQWRQFFLSKYQAPLIGLGETYSRSPLDLAKELFLTRIVQALAPGQEALEKVYSAIEEKLVCVGYLVWDLEKAFAIQQNAKIAAAAYVHQKQPLAVEVKDNQQLGILVLGDFNAAQEVEAEGLPIVDAEAVDVSPEQEEKS